jgi:Xaa-Pro aminopeptidase
MEQKDLLSMQEAIRGEDLDGWLFCNFRHRDKLSDEILGLDGAAANSRRWFYAVPAQGEPLGILHAIESGVLGDLPGRRVFYRSREELTDRLSPLAGKRWGVHVSRFITAISCLDAGTAAFLEDTGLVLVSAAGLIQRFKGLFSPADMAAHEKAADHLYEIVILCWGAVRGAYVTGKAIREGDIQRLILREMESRNLITDHPPIVAAGAHSGNPHYEVRNGGAVFRDGDVIQFDLWARDPGPGGIYADISWVGVYGASSPRLSGAFSDLLGAREGALDFIRTELAAGRRPSGADVDRKTRSILVGLGYEDAIRHRTGHGIDTELHGSGVNMDSVEFPDDRLLLEGSCFSLEPGIYFEDFGLRTEIDVYIRNGEPVVSGRERQRELLCC